MKKLNEILEVINKYKIFDVKTYDFKNTSPFFDYFIILTANDRQQQALSNELAKQFKNDLRSIEGKQTGWMVVDLGYCVIHLFNDEQREHFGLDKMLYGFLIK